MAYKCLLDTTTKVVVNVVELEEGAEWTPPTGMELATQHDGAIGDTWDGTQFVKPPEPVDETEQPLSTGTQVL